MKSVRKEKHLAHLADRVLYYANQFGMDIPEIRFFVLEGNEFLSLLEKHVYPISPMNIWEGKEVSNRRARIEAGLEPSIYYEVVQCGNPSYAYLNHTNSDTMQASVMAHVCGHCEFSQLSLIGNERLDRTEYIMYLVRNVERSRFRMGEVNYLNYWNAVESFRQFTHPFSQYNLSRSIQKDEEINYDYNNSKGESSPLTNYFSETLDTILHSNHQSEKLTQKQIIQTRQMQRLSRQGYRLRAPCEDIMGFLAYYAPATTAEQSILKYLYEVSRDGEFVMLTQIMNEGWAMYWEKKIMLALFKERAVPDIIDYAKVFSGVCYPRPWFQRNPYHLGFHLWKHIEDQLINGRMTIEYFEENDRDQKENWNRNGSDNPLRDMKHIVSTVTDYEFIRRYLTPQLIREFHLNRLPRQMAGQLGLVMDDLENDSDRFVWVKADTVKNEMLNMFPNFYRPRIFIIDDDFRDGGLLLYHRSDGQMLRQDWIPRTLQNLNVIWRRPCYLLTLYVDKDGGESQGILHGYSSSKYSNEVYRYPTFDDVREAMISGRKPVE